MKNRNLKIFVVTSLALLTTFVLGRCGVLPTFLVQNGAAQLVAPGATVEYQVGISQAAPSGGQVLVITPDDEDNFSSIPSTVTVPAGHTTATFRATISDDACGVVSLQAGCNGTSTGCPILVVEDLIDWPPFGGK